MNIDKICEVINNGGIVITPTDTIYGIMGDSLNEDVIRKVFEIKKRPFNKPLLLLMDSFEMVEQYTEEISEKERLLMDRYWPGLVTFILKKNDKVNELITSGNDTVGIRIPNNKDLLEIIRRLNRPVISTSANITGTEVITNTQLLEKDLIDNIDYIEDGGEVDSESSTIIKIEDNKLVVLREGKLSREIEEYYKENL
ncbi:MAG: threonylcarbamoyl-AMP synthase [Bacilli bacterium]|nr:threonylcarbamoyl-AMP synthase [Bacilli bacterium]